MRRTGCNDLQAKASKSSTLHGFLTTAKSFRIHRLVAERRRGVLPAYRAMVARVPVTVGITTGM
jgi:hypothetical protein